MLVAANSFYQYTSSSPLLSTKYKFLFLKAYHSHAHISIKTTDTLAMLEYKKWYYETAKKARTCRIHELMNPDDIPAKFHNIREQAKGS